jgi:hypothetical protein
MVIALSAWCFTRIVPVAVFLADLSILAVYNKLRLLVLAYLPCNVYSILLGVSMLNSTFTTADFDIPAATLSGDHMMSFGHNFSDLQ